MAQGEQENPAKDHFYKGLGLYQAKKYKEALDAFEEAYRIHPHWKLRYNIAMCHYMLKHNAQAANQISAFLEEGGDEVPLDQVNHAGHILEELEDKVGILRVWGKLGKSVVIVDGRVLEDIEPGKAVFLEPGLHSVSIVLGKNALVEEEIDMEAGKARTINVKIKGDEPEDEIIYAGDGSADDMKTEPGPEHLIDGGIVAEPVAPGKNRKKMSATRKAAWATLAGGLGMWLACAVTGGLVLSEKSDMRDAEDEYLEIFAQDPDSARLDELRKERDDHFDKGGGLVTASNVLLGLGGAFMAAMAVLFIVEETGKGEAKTGKRQALTVGPGSLHLTLDF